MDKELIIDKLIKGEVLSDEETKLYTSLLQSDEEFKQSVDFYKQLKAPLKLVERDKLKEKLVSLESNQVKQKSTRLYYIAPIAASLALLISAFLFWDNSSNSLELANEFNQAYPSIIAPITKGNSNATSALDEAMTSYQNKQYNLAIDLFNKVDNQSDTLQFYKASALMQLTSYAGANELLGDLSNKNGRFQQPAEWYLALNYILQDKSAEAIVLLKQITSDKEHPYYSEALSLLNNL